MANHINLIRDIACKNKLQDILASYQREKFKKSNATAVITPVNPVIPDPYQYEIIDIRKYTMMLNILKFDIHRIFIQTHDSRSLYETGWVIDDSCQYCLGCCKDFGVFGVKHHCRACGDRICGRCTCSSKVQSIEHLGEVKVCFKCYRNRDAQNNVLVKGNIHEGVSILADIEKYLPKPKPVMPPAPPNSRASSITSLVPPAGSPSTPPPNNSPVSINRALPPVPSSSQSSVNSRPNSGPQSVSFPRFGLRITYLNEFIQKTTDGNFSLLDDLTVPEVCEKFIKPMTLYHKVSYCDLMRMNFDNNAQLANIYVCYSSKILFNDLLKAIYTYFPSPVTTTQHQQYQQLYLWLELFSQNHHYTITKPIEYYSQSLPSAIQSIGYTLVVATWNQSYIFQDFRLLYDIFLTIILKKKLEITFTSQENEYEFFQTFLQLSELEKNDIVIQDLVKINIEKALIRYQQQQSDLYSMDGNHNNMMMNNNSMDEGNKIMDCFLRLFPSNFYITTGQNLIARDPTASAENSTTFTPGTVPPPPTPATSSAASVSSLSSQQQSHPQQQPPQPISPTTHEKRKKMISSINSMLQNEILKTFLKLFEKLIAKYISKTVLDAMIEDVRNPNPYLEGETISSSNLDQLIRCYYLLGLLYSKLPPTNENLVLSEQYLTIGYKLFYPASSEVNPTTLPGTVSTPMKHSQYLTLKRNVLNKVPSRGDGTNTPEKRSADIYETNSLSSNNNDNRSSKEKGGGGGEQTEQVEESKADPVFLSKENEHYYFHILSLLIFIKFQLKKYNEAELYCSLGLKFHSNYILNPKRGKLTLAQKEAEDINLSEIYYYYSYVYYIQENYIESEKYLLKCYEIQKLLLKESSLSFLKTANLLGLIYQKIGAYGKAIQYHEPFHERMKYLYNSFIAFASFHDDDEEEEEEDDEYQRNNNRPPSALFSAPIEEISRLYCDSNYDLAVDYKNSHNYSKAEFYYLHYYLISCEIYHEKDYRAITACYTLGLFYYEILNNYLEAYKYFSLIAKDYSILEKYYAVGSQNKELKEKIYEFFYFYAKLYYDCNEYQESEKILIEYLQKYSLYYGEKHPKTLFLLFLLCCTYEKLTRFIQAEKYYRLYFDRIKDTYGEDDIQTIQARENLNLFYERQAHYQAATNSSVALNNNNNTTNGISQLASPTVGSRPNSGNGTPLVHQPQNLTVSPSPPANNSSPHQQYQQHLLQQQRTSSSSPSQQHHQKQRPSTYSPPNLSRVTNFTNSSNQNPNGLSTSTNEVPPYNNNNP